MENSTEQVKDMALRDLFQNYFGALKDDKKLMEMKDALNDKGDIFWDALMRMQDRKLETLHYEEDLSISEMEKLIDDIATIDEIADLYCACNKLQFSLKRVE